MIPGDAQALQLHRRTGELWTVKAGRPVELLGHLPARAVRKITDKLPYTPGVMPLVVTHGYPPVVEWYPGKELTEDEAGPLLAVLAYSVLARAKAASS